MIYRLNSQEYKSKHRNRSGVQTIVDEFLTGMKKLRNNDNPCEMWFSETTKVAWHLRRCPWTWASGESETKLRPDIFTHVASIGYTHKI